MMGITGVLLLLLVGVWAAPEEDIITSLPGWDAEIPFKQYSGYLDGLEGQHIHYWFQESQRDPAVDPIILWLNGGPGCSGVESSLDEFGPFFISHEDEFSLYQNPFSWNLNASLLLVESPVCVGYSYSDDGSCHSYDDTTSEANYLAIQDFFNNKFPEYYGNDFYIFGESYGGIYVPTLAQRVQEGISTYPLQFKGWATGNGMLDFSVSDNSLMFYAYHHGVFGDSLWDRLVEHCCEGAVPSQDTCTFRPWGDSTSIDCINAVEEGEQIVYYSGINPYALYGECLHPPESVRSDGAPSRMEIDMKYLHNNIYNSMLQDKSHTGVPVPCFDDHVVENWVSRADVREAFHIPDHVAGPWYVCSDIPYTQTYENMSAQFQYLNSQGVKGLVYNGDWDMMCQFLGNEWFLESQGFTEVEAYREWFYGDQVAGYIKRWENLDFVTIKGAGHTSPQFKPAQVQKMIYNFINGQPL